MSTTVAWPADWLPRDVVEFRRELLDMFWDSRRFELFGDEAAGDPDAFVGKCPDCGGCLEVWFHPQHRDAKLRCWSGCEAELVRRLGLRAR